MQLNDFVSPYKTAEEAAAYIRKGLSTFRKYVRQYQIPRHGPAGDRFLVDDLEAFMADSHRFLGQTRSMRKRKAGPFTPVKL